MRYLEKQNGKSFFTSDAKNDYHRTQEDQKDAVVMDLLGSLGFACGKSRWDGVILWTHIDSRRIVIAVKCPPNVYGWVGCPYTTPNPGQTFAFVHDQSYEIRIFSDERPRNLIGCYHIISEKNGEHWLSLPQEIRKAWDETLM